MNLNFNASSYTVEEMLQMQITINQMLKKAEEEERYVNNITQQINHLAVNYFRNDPADPASPRIARGNTNS
jgi:hypothetical protein